MSGPPLSVLVIEDSALVRRFLETWAERRGHAVVAVQDGESALRELDRRPFDLVVLDLKLPGIGGMEVLAGLRGRSDGDRPHVVVVTGNENDRALQAALDGGADDYVTKAEGEQSLLVRLRIAEGQARARIERHEASEALRRAELGLRQIIDLIPHMVFARNADGRFILANRAFAELHGKRFAELIGSTPATLFDDAFANEVLGHDRQVLETGRALALGERRVRDASGSERTFDLVKIPFTSMLSSKRAVLGLGIDVTERRRTEEALRKSEKAAALSALVASIAHEVRNPLFALSASLDTVERRFATETESMADYVARMRSNLDRIAVLVDEMLEYGQPHDPDFETLPLVDVVRDAIDETRHEAENGRVVVELVAAAPSASVRVERRRLSHALRHVVENAVQHSPPGATVRVSLELEEGDRVACRIRDGGGGFAREVLERAFDPFVSMRQGGVGLGLAIASRVAEEHGGTIRLANADGGGGVVVLSLPVAG